MYYLAIEIEGYTSRRLTTKEEVGRLITLKRMEDKLSGRLSDLHLVIGEVAPMENTPGYFQEEFQKRSEEAERIREGLKQIKEEIKATGLCIPCCGNGLELVEECEETTIKICDHCIGTGRTPLGNIEDNLY